MYIAHTDIGKRREKIIKKIKKKNKKNRMPKQREILKSTYKVNYLLVKFRTLSASSFDRAQ